MLYIPIRSDKAQQLSASIYQLMRPPALRSVRDVSQFYCRWIQHPTRPEVAVIVVPETETVPIHVHADGELLQATLAAFVPTEITQEEVDGLSAAIVASAGSSVPVAAFVPASWQPYVMDYQTAIDTGWLAQPPSV